MQIVAESHPLKELRQELRLHRLCEEVVLDPFSEVEVAEYLQQRLPDSGIQEAFIHKLHDHTGGLPLFLANVIDDMVAGSQSTAWSVPESLAGAIEKHIARLGPEAQRLLEAASFCGVEFRATTLAEVLGQDLQSITRQCDDLAQRQYWLQHVAVVDLPDGTLDARYAFRHALYRHVFYQRQGASTRVQMHRRVAAALEHGRAAGVPITAAELASQHEAGLAHAAALRYYAEAARSAVNNFAPREAIDITSHALALLPRCPEGNERLELEFALVSIRGLACSQQFGLASSEGEIAYRRALELCDVLPLTPVRAQVLGGLAWMYYIRGEYTESLQLAQRMEALARTHDDALLAVAACCLLGVIHTMRGKHLEARGYLERGLEICASLGDKVPLAAFVADPIVVLKVNLAIPLMHLGLVDQARAQMDAALMRGRQRGELMARTIALWCAAMFEMRMQRPDRVAEHAQALRKLVDDHAIGQAQGPSRWVSGWAEAHLGSPQEGLRLILEGFEHNRRAGMLAGGSEVLGYAVEALLLASDLDGAQAHLDQARELGQRFGERILFMYHHMLQSRIDVGRGDIAAARHSLESAVVEAGNQGSLYMEVRLLVHICSLPDANNEGLCGTEGGVRPPARGIQHGNDQSRPRVADRGPPLKFPELIRLTAAVQSALTGVFCQSVGYGLRSWQLDSSARSGRLCWDCSESASRVPNRCVSCTQSLSNCSRRSRRRNQKPGPQSARVNAFGRAMSLSLEDNSRLLRAASPQTRARLSSSSVLKGSISGVHGSWVRLTLTDGAYSGAIWDGSDLYFVEPRATIEKALIVPLAGTAQGSAILSSRRILRAARSRRLAASTASARERRAARKLSCARSRAAGGGRRGAARNRSRARRRLRVHVAQRRAEPRQNAVARERRRRYLRRAGRRGNHSHGLRHLRERHGSFHERQSSDAARGVRQSSAKRRPRSARADWRT